MQCTREQELRSIKGRGQPGHTQRVRERDLSSHNYVVSSTVSVCVASGNSVRISGLSEASNEVWTEG